MSALPTDTTQWLALRAHVEPECLRPGERGVLVVEAEIPPGCHIEAHEPSEPFLVPAELNLEPVEGATIGPVRYPATEDKQFVWSPAVQLIEVELDINSDKSCNNEMKLEGESDANPH
jgi:hypothetical protein